MAISIGTIAPASPPEQTGSNNNTTHSYDVTCTADTDVVVIFAASYNTNAVSGSPADRASATWDSSPLTELDWYTQGGSFSSDQPLQAWLVTSPGSGTHALEITTPAAGGSATREFLSVAIPLEGVDLTALPTAFETAGASSGTDCSITVATEVGNLILTMGTTWDIGQSAHTGTVLAQYDEEADNSAYAAWNVMSTVADSSSEVIGWTATTSDDWMIVALEFVPAAGGTTDVTPAPTAVTIVAATGNVGGQADVTPSATVVSVVAAVGNVTGSASVAPSATVVAVVAATAAISAQADIAPTGTVVTVVAGTADVEQTVLVTPTGTVVTAATATADVTGHAAVTGTATVVTTVAPTAQLTAQADIAPVAAIVAAVAAIAGIGLAVIVPPPERTTTVAAKRRVTVVPAETRTTVVPAESRTTAA